MEGRAKMFFFPGVEQVEMSELPLSAPSDTARWGKTGHV